MRQHKRILVIEDDPSLLKALGRLFHKSGYDVELAPTLRDGLALLPRGFDLVVTDILLPDGSGVSIAEAAYRLRPAPIVIAVTGMASRTDSFRLAQAGAVALIEKPFDTFAFLEKVRELLEAPPPSLDPFVPGLVGRVPLRDVVDRVREDMSTQALALANGNKAEAARLLGVTRQAVQQFFKKPESAG